MLITLGLHNYAHHAGVPTMLLNLEFTMHAVAREFTIIILVYMHVMLTRVSFRKKLSRGEDSENS